jgi:thermitase
LAVVTVLAAGVLARGVLLGGERVLACGSVPACEAEYSEGDSSDCGTSSARAYSVEESYLADRWGLGRIEARRAWDITIGDGSVIVAVLDTGISRANRDLSDRVVMEVNLTTSPTSDDLYGHGTHMAGTIAAVAPGCSLMNVKVADDRGKCDPAVVARGIIWAVDRGAGVINLSLAMETSPQLEAAVDYAWSKGAVVVAAAGNRGRSEPSYPAYYASSLAVAGTNHNDSLALLSSYGYWVDVVAPGFNIYSELPGDQHGYKTGTSAAAAHVSGVAALVMSLASDRNGDGVVNDEVRWAIENSCTPLSGDGLGQGLVNAYRAVSIVVSGP